MGLTRGELLARAGVAAAAPLARPNSLPPRPGGLPIGKPLRVSTIGIEWPDGVHDQAQRDLGFPIKLQPLTSVAIGTIATVAGSWRPAPESARPAIMRGARRRPAARLAGLGSSATMAGVVTIVVVVGGGGAGLDGGGGRGAGLAAGREAATTPAAVVRAATAVAGPLATPRASATSRRP